MSFRKKILHGIALVRSTSGFRNKISTTKKLARAAMHSRFRIRSSINEDLAAETWADYNILKFVNRNVNVRLSRCDSPRVWFILPELNANVIFGGYIALYHYILHVRSLGIKTGIVSLSPIPSKKKLLSDFTKNPVAHDALKSSEIQTIGVSNTVTLGSLDMLVSYNWTASLVAAKMARFLKDPSYYYFIQEDERIFYANDAYRFLCESVFYNRPKPRFICNSKKLRDHFESAGLFDKEAVVGVFEQSLQEYEMPSKQVLSSRKPRKFAFYGRPEDHAKRNLMTIAMLAISKARRDGAFDSEPWEFYMLGSQKMGNTFDLEGVKFIAVPNQAYDDYRRTLLGFDAGLALMYAPHPSVPPFEMVRSGMITVVNTNEQRTDEWYRDVSANFEPGFPSIEGLAAAICRATERVSEVESRLAASKTYHPTDWVESFANLPNELQHAIFDQIDQS